MVSYKSILNLWRPISNKFILVYNTFDVCQALGITRVQLTALAVISCNDYGKNIMSLGLATNYSVLKGIEEEGKYQ